MFLGFINDVGERREPIETCESVPRTLDHWVHFDILRRMSIPERAFPVRVHVENAGTLPWRCQGLAHARERFYDLNTGSGVRIPLAIRSFSSKRQSTSATKAINFLESISTDASAQMSIQGSRGSILSSSA